MEKKRERIDPREYAGDILKAAITLTLAQGTESAIDFVAGALDLVRAEGKDRFENQVKILSDQLEIEQASKRTCPSCGLLWPNHDDNCGLWISAEALVRIRAETEAEVTKRVVERCIEIACNRRDKEYNASKFKATIGKVLIRKHDWVVQFHNGAALAASEISQEIKAAYESSDAGEKHGTKI